MYRINFEIVEENQVYYGIKYSIFERFQVVGATVVNVEEIKSERFDFGGKTAIRYSASSEEPFVLCIVHDRSFRLNKKKYFYSAVVSFASCIEWPANLFTDKECCECHSKRGKLHRKMDCSYEDCPFCFRRLFGRCHCAGYLSNLSDLSIECTNKQYRLFLSAVRRKGRIPAETNRFYDIKGYSRSHSLLDRKDATEIAGLFKEGCVSYYQNQRGEVPMAESGPLFFKEGFRK